MRTSTWNVSAIQDACLCSARSSSRKTSKLSQLSSAPLALLVAHEGTTLADSKQPSETPCLFWTQECTTEAASTKGASSWHSKNFRKCPRSVFVMWSPSERPCEGSEGWGASGKAQAKAGGTEGCRSAVARGSSKTRHRRVSKTCRIRKSATVGAKTPGVVGSRLGRPPPLVARRTGRETGIGGVSLPTLSAAAATLDSSTCLMAQLMSLSARTSFSSSTPSSKTSER
mmetsp:Transcript_90766/g.265689  ORF Transcript_90766/g.265689 Transcript_90766/m.265689 type:complete len:228 (+) Transcript_90766:973-1656(+)